MGALSSPMMIQGVGACSGLASRSLSLAMCARANQMEPRPCRFLDRRGVRVGVCRVAGIPEDVVGYDRVLRLARRALLDVAPAMTEPPEPIPAILTLPDAARPDDDPRYAHEFLGALSAMTGVRLDIARSRVLRGGNASAAAALEGAAEMLRERPGVKAILAGGVDSYYHPETIRWLSEEHRLHTPHEDDEGMIPGEGAAFLLLSRADRRSSHRAITAVGVDQEPAATNGEPNLGTAMTRLVRAVAASGQRPVDWVLSDVNADAWRAREWSKVCFRKPFPEGARDRDAELALRLGDLGAATGFIFAAIAEVWWRVGCAPGSSLLIAMHSEGAERGAFLVEERA